MAQSAKSKPARSRSPKTSKQTKPTKKPKKSASQKTTPAATEQKTRFKRLKRIGFPKRQSKAEKPKADKTKKVSGSFRLLRDSFSVFRDRWPLFLRIVMISIFLLFLFAGGLGGNINTLKQRLVETQLDTGGLGEASRLFSMLVASPGNDNSETGPLYQTILIVIISLALIWAIRRVMASEKASARDAFYAGMYPLIPFILVLAVLTIEMLPLLIGGTIYNNLVSSLLGISLAETFGWGLLIFLLFSISFYLLPTSIFALYIVTLPNMRPVRALRSARQLVRGRRFKVVRKLLFLPIALTVIGAIIVIPAILIMPIIGQWTFTVASVFGLAIAHIYIYNLYRELL